MFRRIDLWVGCHMGVKRWIAVWMIVVIGGIQVCNYRWWGFFIGVPVAFVGILGIHGNARRLK